MQAQSLTEQKWDDAPADQDRLGLDTIARLNRQRCQRWHTGSELWSGADWANAMQGEAGEAGNVVKKIRRIETGLTTTGVTSKHTKEELVAKLAHECADVMLYLDLLCDYYGIDLARAVVEKFNIVSEKQGFPERLELLDPGRGVTL